MPGSVPGIEGYAAFVGVKFTGYCLAGWVLKKSYPGVSDRAVTIASTRTAIGLLVGPLVVYGSMWFVARSDPGVGANSAGDWVLIPFYGELLGLRIVIWGIVVYLFCRNPAIRVSRLIVYAWIGAIWSCILDIPGIALAWVAPGKVPFC